MNLTSRGTTVYRRYAEKNQSRPIETSWLWQVSEGRNDSSYRSLIDNSHLITDKITRLKYERLLQSTLSNSNSLGIVKTFELQNVRIIEIRIIKALLEDFQGPENFVGISKSSN